MIYLDSSATAPLLPVVRDRLIELMNFSVNGELGNPSSLHSAGVFSKSLLTSARKTVGSFLRAENSTTSIIFTSGGTESNNTVLHSFENAPVLTSAIEHPSVLRPAELYGNPFIKLPVDRDGIVDLEFLNRALADLRAKTARRILVSVMLANNETGIIEPIKSISTLIKKYKKVYLHTDATQAVGKIPVSVADLGVDYLTFSGHKLGAPVGIGVLYVRPGAPLKPLLLGGAQELSRRAGTENVLLASALKTALDFHTKNHSLEKYNTKVRELRNYLEHKIRKYLASKKTQPQTSRYLPNVLNLSFPAIEGESLQLHLDLENISVSTGSACASGSLEPSHVLMAMTGDPETAHGSIRFSLNLDTTKADIDLLLEKLPPILNRLRNLSTLTKGIPHA